MSWNKCSSEHFGSVFIIFLWQKRDSPLYSRHRETGQ